MEFVFEAAEGSLCRSPPPLFDLAVSECGASPYCEPGRWIAEVARLLRPGGRLVFHTVSVLAAICQRGDDPAGRELHQPLRDVRRLHGRRGVEYHPGHSEWIRVLTAAGLVIDALHELYAPPGAADHPYYQIATADWSRRWPVEDIWIAHRPAL
jgi:SAM-dependent methyltransferase